MTKRLIGASVRYGDKKTKSAVRRLFCLLDGECPVLANGQCIHVQWLGQCIYGAMYVKEGFTTRAHKSYRPWMKKAREQTKDAPPMPKYPDKRLVVVGEYVWLPYPHMNHIDINKNETEQQVEFVQFSGPFMAGGLPFIKIEDLTAEAICRIVSFKPYALTGREIKDYQQKSVPAFLNDLKREMPELYAAALELCPEIAEKTPDWSLYREQTVPVSEVKPGTNIQIGNKARKSGTWDGKWFILDESSARSALSILSINYRFGSARVSIQLNQKTKVRVLDNKEIQRLFEAGVYSGAL